MSPRRVQRFWDNDTHQNKDLKSPEAMVRSVDAQTGLQAFVAELFARQRVSVRKI